MRFSFGRLRHHGLANEGKHLKRCGCAGFAVQISWLAASAAAGEDLNFYSDFPYYVETRARKADRHAAGYYTREPL
jgi:hypothetical protein